MSLPTSVFSEFPVKNFYKKKSITTSYNFSVWLDFSKYLEMSGGAFAERANNLFYYLNKIAEYHFVSVDFPFNSFQRESVNVGTMQYSYPVLASEQALDIRITLEEDDRANVAGLIHSLQNTIVGDDGYHVPPLLTTLGDIFIFVRDPQGQVIGTYWAKDVFFLGANGYSGSYDNGDALKYELTFGTNYYEYVPSTGPDSELRAKKFPLFNVGALLGTAAIFGAGAIANATRPSSVTTGTAGGAFNSIV